MLHKKRGKQLSNAIPASLVAEIALPRIAKSAKVALLNLATTRTPEQPSAIVPRNVDRIIPSRSAAKPEKAQIAVERTDEHGDGVKLKKSARAEVTLTARVSPRKLTYTART